MKLIIECAYRLLFNGKIACSVVQHGTSSLRIFNPSDASSDVMDLPYCSISSIQSHNNKLFFIASSSTESTRIIGLTLEDNSLEIVKETKKVPLTEENISIPEPITYSTSDNKETYALFYKPKNNKYQVILKYWA